MKKRIAGLDISTPIVGGGVSWEHIQEPKDRIQHLFTYLESKRILTNPSYVELVDQCISSALEIKLTLVNLTKDFIFDNDDMSSINKLIDVCNKYLNDVNQKSMPRLIYKQGDNWAEISFDEAMKTFRYAFRDEIQVLEKRHGILFRKEIPDKY